MIRLRRNRNVCYNLKTMIELDLRQELGETANKSNVEGLTAEISSAWEFKGEPAKKPIVLMLGGFQGSGKTTVLEVLRKNLDFVVISPDQIRYRLFEKGWERGEEFTQTVNATRNSLLRKALSLGYHVIIDQLTTEARINLARQITEEVDRNYRVISVYIDAQQEVLEQRVQTRRGFPQTYQGTLEELRQSYEEHGQLNFGLYDRVLHSDRMTPEQIAKEIKVLFPQN